MGLRSKAHFADQIPADVLFHLLSAQSKTSGEVTSEFEKAVAHYVNAPLAVAVNSITAALHTTFAALNMGEADEVLVPALAPITIAHAVLYLGARPVFCDVDPNTLLVDCADAEKKVSSRTRAIVAFDYAGGPCDYTALREFATRSKLFLVGDSRFALGATYRGEKIGSVADLTVLGFPGGPALSPGGIICTASRELAHRMKKIRNLGISDDSESCTLGFEYSVNELQALLAKEALRQLPENLAERRKLAARYEKGLAALSALSSVKCLEPAGHARHDYVLRIDFSRLSIERQDFLHLLAQEGVPCEAQPLPTPLHPYYRERFGLGTGQCPVAEKVYQEIVLLPLSPAMTVADSDRGMRVIKNICRQFER